MYLCISQLNTGNSYVPLKRLQTLYSWDEFRRNKQMFVRMKFTTVNHRSLIRRPEVYVFGTEFGLKFYCKNPPFRFIDTLNFTYKFYHNITLYIYGKFMMKMTSAAQSCKKYIPVSTKSISVIVI